MILQKNHIKKKELHLRYSYSSEINCRLINPCSRGYSRLPERINFNVKLEVDFEMEPRVMTGVDISIVIRSR